MNATLTADQFIRLHLNADYTEDVVRLIYQYLTTADPKKDLASEDVLLPFQYVPMDALCAYDVESLADYLGTCHGVAPDEATHPMLLSWLCTQTRIVGFSGDTVVFLRW